MAATAVELSEEEGSKGADERHTFIVTGADTKGDAQDAVEAAAPAMSGALYRQPVHVVEIPGWPGAWVGTATYGTSDFTPPAVGDTALNFDTTGGTAHIVSSVDGSPRVKYPTLTAPETNGLIGVTKNGVDGVDIVSRAFAFGYTRYVAAADMTPTYVRDLFELTGTVNDDLWSFTDTTGVTVEFGAREVLFLGAQGSARGKTAPWQINFKFVASPNRDDLKVGTITDIVKDGWDYLWVMYADDDDDSHKSLTKKPIGVYVEKVYEDQPFNLLDP